MVLSLELYCYGLFGEFGEFVVRITLRVAFAKKSHNNNAHAGWLVRSFDLSPTRPSRMESTNTHTDTQLCGAHTNRTPHRSGRQAQRNNPLRVCERSGRSSSRGLTGLEQNVVVDNENYARLICRTIFISHLRLHGPQNIPAYTTQRNAHGSNFTRTQKCSHMVDDGGQ